MIHLVKLCVGIETPQALASAQKKHRRPFHVTRNFPQRADELRAGGSLYWVFGGQIRARQRIAALEAVYDEDHRRKCKIVFDKKIHLTQNQPYRAFQGWRYLEQPPPDLDEDEMAKAAFKELGFD